MQHFETVALQEASGTKRINVENLTKLPEVGFKPGQPIEVTYFPKQHKIVVEATKSGTRVISPKNYKYKDGVRIGSRIDIKNKSVMMVFGHEEELMMIYSQNKLLFCLTPRSKSIRERIRFMMHAVIYDNKITSASLFGGVGAVDIGLEQGLNRAGMDSELLFINEINAKFVDVFTNNNPTYKPNKTVTAALDMHQLFPAALPDVHLWTAGPVCKSYSKLNTKHRDAPEFDEMYGHLTTSTLMTLQSTQFKSPIIFIEQVVPYFQSISFHQLKTILKIKGYKMHLAGDFHPKSGNYQGVSSKKYGDIENRRRLFAAFVTEGINIDLSFMDELARVNQMPIKQLLDDAKSIPDKAFNIGTSLKVKSLTTDWKNKVVDDSVTSVSTISAGYGRVRIEDPKLLKDGQNLLGDFRLFTADEITRFKQLPEGLVDGVSAKKDQYTILGNGPNGGVMTAFFYAIAKSLKVLNQPWSNTFTASQECQEEIRFASAS